jgi:hypothetical protein
MTDERVGEEERAEAYLEGALSPDDAAAFERDLANRPEVADALGAAILLRDLLGRMPPLDPPPGLEERIVAALPIGRGPRPAARDAGRGDRPSTVPAFRAALRGAGWLFRPTAAVMHGGSGGARPVAAGLGQVRWFFGPLGARRAESEATPRRAVWRRVIGRLG